jgi:hypothetical protein
MFLDGLAKAQGPDAALAVRARANLVGTLSELDAAIGPEFVQAALNNIRYDVSMKGIHDWIWSPATERELAQFTDRVRDAVDAVEAALSGDHAPAPREAATAALECVRVDNIREVEIDAAGRLLITPNAARFPYIYREAMEVHWEESCGYLFSPKPREWSYLDWFRQILEAARTQGCVLRVADDTRWLNIPVDLIAEMQASGGGAGRPRVAEK